MTEEDLMIRRHILNLMCNFKTTWDNPSEQFEELPEILEQLQEMEDDGLLIIGDQSIEVTEEGKSTFSNYIFDDAENDVIWSLIENKTTILTAKNETSQLFDAVDITVFLLPEYKKADYLLKIENIDYDFDEEEIIGKILSLKNVTTVYALDANNLKSKNNLIF